VATNAAIYRRKLPLLLVSAIAAVAVLLASFSYLFFNDAANKIIEIAASEDKTSARILTHDLANSLANKLQGIQQNVQIIAQSPSVQDKSIEEVKTLLRVTQQTSNDLTDFYGWLDKDGKIVWASGIVNNEITASVQVVGADRSDRDWFINARDTGKAYASSVGSSLDGTNRLFISYPIIDSQSGSFEGVIYAGVPLAKINNYLGSQIYSGKEATIILLDMKGTILQTQYPDLLGMNYFSKEYQTAIARMERPDDSEGLEKFVQHALADTLSSSSQPDVAEFTYSGQTVSTAYSHVKVGTVTFGVIFTKVPHVIASNVGALIDYQRYASWARIAAVGAGATIISVLIISWNRRLEKTVAERTQELASKTEELAAANELLKQNDKMQKEFVNIAAHELRTPITPILTSIDMAECVKDLDGENRIMLSEEFYDRILRNVKRLEKLSSDLLQTAKIESGTLRLIKEKFDLNKLIGDVVIDTSRSMPNSKRDIQIVFEPNRDEELIVEADQTKLYEVLTNLIQNAIRFTLEGKIVISTERSNDDGGAGNIVIKIKDTGSGIAQDILPRLFQKFISASSSYTVGGTGLGLYISKNIIEAHEGKIWVENNVDGKGATFSFSIPLQNTKS
jgi:signal transduction histidine kinase